jgi:hypothetical protein
VKNLLTALGLALALCCSVLLTGCDDAHAAAGAPPLQLSALPDATGAFALADPADKGSGQAVAVGWACTHAQHPRQPRNVGHGNTCPTYQPAVSGPGEGDDGNGEPEPAEQPEAIPIGRAG